MDLRDLVTIEIGGYHGPVGADIPVNYPFIFVHKWEWFILGQPVNSIAGLSPDVRSLLLFNSLFVFAIGKQRLSFEVR